jgi:hypothetical protein
VSLSEGRAPYRAGRRGKSRRVWRPAWGRCLCRGRVAGFVRVGAFPWRISLHFHCIGHLVRAHLRASLTLTELARVCCCVRPPGRPRPRRLDVDLSHGRLTFNDIRNRRRRLVPRRAGRVARSARVNPMHPPTGPKRHAPMHAPPSRPRAPQPRTGRVFRGVFYTIHRPHRAPRAGASIEWRPQPRGQRGSLAPHARSVYRTSVLSLIAPVPRYASSTNQLQCAYPCAMPHI